MKIINIFAPLPLFKNHIFFSLNTVKISSSPFFHLLLLIFAVFFYKSYFSPNLPKTHVFEKYTPLVNIWRKDMIHQHQYMKICFKVPYKFAMGILIELHILHKQDILFSLTGYTPYKHIKAWCSWNMSLLWYWSIQNT